MKKISIIEELYSAGWFYSGFLHYNFHHSLKLLILDRFIIFGTLSVFSFGLVIIELNKNLLEKSSPDQILRILQDPSSSPYLQNPRKVFNVWNKMWMTENKFQQILSGMNCKMRN
jgi:hypothetical protein